MFNRKIKYVLISGRKKRGIIGLYVTNPLGIIAVAIGAAANHHTHADFSCCRPNTFQLSNKLTMWNNTNVNE